MSTPASGTSAYATPTDFQNREDSRSVQQLLSDTGVPLTPSQVTSSAALAALLQEASGWVESACTVGQRYQINPSATPPINDLQTIITAGQNSAQLLIGLVCDIAFWLLWNRRPHMDGQKPPAQVEMALKMLEALEKGSAVFGILEVATAGLPGHYTEQPTDFENRTGPVIIAKRLFGNRSADTWPQAQ